MKTIFKLTYDLLMFLSRVTGFSYKEINVIVWFIIIPLSWAYLIDKIFNKNYVKITLSVLLIITFLFINNFSNFSNYLFDKSAEFLRSFDTLGSNYVNSSVIICLLIPIIIYAFLISKVYFKPTKD